MTLGGNIGISRELHQEMKTLICPTCGCSLVRLGISKEEAAAYSYKGEEYLFCCEGCVEKFTTNPQEYLQKIDDLVVCPVCLAEKPLERVVTLKIAGQEVHFCGCPRCVEKFTKEPEYHIKRLAGMVE